MLPKQVAQATKSKVNIKRKEPLVRQYGRNRDLNQWEEIEFPMVIPEVEPVYQEALDYYLKGNPFLHTLDSNFEINNLEQYYCFYKNQYIQMSDVIRNGQYRKFTQRKILNKNFKLWKKDYSQDKHETIKVVESTFAMIGDVKFNKFGPFKRLLLLLAFVLMMSIIYNQNELLIRVLGLKRGTAIVNSMDVYFDNNRWAIKFFNLSIYSIIGGFLYFKFRDTVLKDYQKNYNNARKILANSKSIINRDFKKKTRRAKKYYLNKVIRKPDKYPPLKIENVCQTKVNLNKFEKISSTVVVKGASIKKRQWLFNTLNYFFVILSFIGTLSLIILIIFLLVKDIFF